MLRYHNLLPERFENDSTYWHTQGLREAQVRMICSAVECRREGSATSRLDSTDFTRPKYSACARRSSATKTDSTDLLRYASARTTVLSKSDELRERSWSRDSSVTRSTVSSRSRTSSYSDGLTSKPPLRKPVTFELDQFRNLYGPTNYVVGSTRGSVERSSGARGVVEVVRTRTAPVAARPSRPAEEVTSPPPATPSASPDDSPEECTPPEPPPLPEQEESSPESGRSVGSVGTVAKPPAGPLLPPLVSASRKDPPSPAAGLPSPTDSTAGLSGLRNIGNTCFLNSVVQCLSNTRLLKDYLVNRDYLSDITNTESKGALIKSFAEVVCELWSGEGKLVNTTAFKAQIQRYAPRFMGYSQQDSQEFLRYLLQGIHDDVNRVTTKPRNLPPVDDNLSDSVKASECWKQYLKVDNSRIVDLFVGQLKSTLQCTVCSHCSTTFEVFWDLSLPLPSRAGSLRLSQCLDHFTKEEILDGDEMPTCSKCKTRRKCTKSFSIHKFPKILVLHLKRFSPSERYRKLSAQVEFPLTGLDMSTYASAGQPLAPSYNLYAVSNHSGTAYSGHYTAYCLHPHSHQWHEYNDSRVSSISGRNVVSSEAYILFYEQSSTPPSTMSRL